MASDGTKYLLRPTVHEGIDHEAAAFDQNTGDFINAVLAGVLARGIAGDLAIQAIDRGLVPPPKRRMRPRLPWEHDGENWHYGPWTMVRRGDHRHNEATKLPGEGWFLYGPGLDEPRDLKAMARAKATDAANEYIAMHPAPEGD